VMTRPLIAVAAGFLLWGEMLAGIQSGPSRINTGTGIIAGTVVTGSDPAVPVRRATVRLVLEGTVSPRLAGTDENGRYVFDGLPKGRYSLSASKPGFLETFHGGRRPGRGPGGPVALTDAGLVDIPLTLVRGATITGVISDALGRPVPSVAVVAVPLQRSSGALTRAETDDRGVYRLFGLAPDEYLIAALPRLSQSTTPISATTDAEIQWALDPDPRALPPPGRPVEYTPVFFPGTVDAGAANPVMVRTGEEQVGVSFSLRIVNVSTISGTILDDTGVPSMTATVALEWRRRGEAATTEALATSGAISLPRAIVTPPTFVIAGVWPGEYTLTVSSRAGRGGGPPGPPGRGVLWGIADVTVDGLDDLKNIQVTLRPGLQMTGDYRFSGTGPQPDSNAFSLTLTRQAASPVGTGDVQATLDPTSGRLRFASVPPGRYILKSNVPAPWFLESATLDGRDLADTPLDVNAGGETRAGLLVTFSDRPARIDGQLVDDAGVAITAYAVVVFPLAEAEWRRASRRIRLVHPATDGSFAIAGLPAGEYAIAATDDVEAADLDAALLSELRAVGHRLTLGPGDRYRHTLKIVR